MSKQQLEKKSKKHSINDALTDQQKRFCLEFIKDLSATEAAIRAGYSKASAASQGSRLLTYPRVAAACQRLMDERAKRAKIDADQVLVELIKLAKADIRRVFNDDGSLKSIKEFPDDMAAAVSSVEVEELFEGFGKERHQIGYTKKVKFWDKPKSLELIGKHLKMFTDVIEIKSEERPFQDLSDEELDKIIAGFLSDPIPNTER